MKKKNKPLPTPPSRPFGKKARFNQDETDTLIADQMAMAMAQGKLDDFLEKEMPDNEYARKLAHMMMGMTGMMPQATEKTIAEKKTGKDHTSPAIEHRTGQQAPEEIVEAAQAGEVEKLMELLHKEHIKRSPDAASDFGSEDKKKPASARPTIEQTVIQQLMEIADKNGVSPDWLVLRALKFYVKDYLDTGRL